MSWFWGAIGHLSDDDRQRLATFKLTERLFQYQDNSLTVFAGGIRSTLHGSADNAFIVAGSGIEEHDHSYKLSTEQTWKHALDHHSLPVDGHYAGLHWGDGTYHFFTDPLGLRSIHLYHAKGVLYFSSHEQFLSKLAGRSFDIDWQHFSSRWLLRNQLGKGSVINDVIRLTAGASARFDRNTLEIDRPAPHSASGHSTIAADLDKLLALPGNERLPIHLALSAGLDSRTILAVLLRQYGSDFQTYTFEENDHPEIDIVRKIANTLGLRSAVRTLQLPNDTDILIRQFTDYCIVKQCTANASHFLLSLPYEQFRDLDTGILIDGGFGEIGRRRYFEGIRAFHKKELLTKHAAALFSLLSRTRADIFETSLTRAMETHAADDVAEYFSTNEGPEKIGLEQWLDFLAIRMALPNYYGYEQTRLDGIIQSYSPFTQSTFIQAVLATPVELRRNAKQYRDIIATHAPRLTKFPLVKSNTTYPFKLNTIPASGWTMLKNAVGKTFQSKIEVQFLLRMEAFIRDTSASVAVRNFGAYDHTKIDGLIDRFYKGAYQHASQLNWWITFELWRRSLGV